MIVDGFPTSTGDKPKYELPTSPIRIGAVPYGVAAVYPMLCVFITDKRYKSYLEIDILDGSVIADIAYTFSHVDCVGLFETHGNFDYVIENNKWNSNVAIHTTGITNCLCGIQKNAESFDVIFINNAPKGYQSIIFGMVNSLVNPGGMIVWPKNLDIEDGIVRNAFGTKPLNKNERAMWIDG